MKALVNYMKLASVLLANLICVNATNAQTEFKTFSKNPIPIIVPKHFEGKVIYEDPYESTKLDYYGFEAEGEEDFGTTKGDWYLKYKAMFDFRCKEPFWGVSPKYQKKDFLKSGYLFRLVNSQIIEDSIQFLINKYYYNNNDTLRNWNLAIGNSEPSNEKIIKRLGLSHFKFVICVFDSKKHSKYIEVPEAEQANDNMVYMEVFKYPADVDIFLFNFNKNNWEYIETVTVLGDHELELYVLHKFEPRYLKNCGYNINTKKIVQNIKVLPINPNVIPPSIKYKGKIKDAITYKDDLGENLIITTEFEETYDAEDSDPVSNAELYAYHYIIEKDNAVMLWKVYDFEKECVLDISVHFVENSLQITDLNNDGIAEVWLMYTTSCAGGVDPATMKIIMYENQTKYAMRGTSRVHMGDNKYEGGEYKFDNTFINGPTEFQEFAKTLWKKHIIGR